MRIRGIVRTATLAENPPGTDQIELILHVQGVGPGQPRILARKTWAGTPNYIFAAYRASGTEREVRLVAGPRRLAVDVQHRGDAREAPLRGLPLARLPR